jgi:phosphatidylinositol alpha-1,6-mannosyltransferase
LKKESKISTLLISNDFPPVVSGISTVFYNIWKLFPDRQWPVLAPGVNGAGDFDRASGVETVRYPYINKSGFFPKLINQMMLFIYTACLIVTRRINLLHCGLLLSAGSLGWFFKKVFRIPYYLWVYGDETKEIYRGSTLARLITDAIISNAQKIITNSSYVTTEFVDFGIDKGNIIEIVPAVDSEIFRPAKKPARLVSRYNLSGKTVLMTVSRLAKRKGHENVLNALPVVVKKFPEIVYLIVGKGQEEANLKALAERLGIQEHVVFAGFVPDRELPDYYNACDIFVMPNIEDVNSTDSIEGFGIVFIEANACGKPVIGGRSGGVENGAVVDKLNGFLVDPSDVREISEKILLLLNDPKLARSIGETGRTRVVQQFQWKDRAEAIRTI